MPRGLTDIHCHILPYVDDGSDDEDETRDLIAMQSRQGVDRIGKTTAIIFSCTNCAEAGLSPWPGRIIS